MDSKEFAELMVACSDVSSMFPDGVVYIGGIAVYLHAKNAEATSELAEFTHDADFYISMSDMADLRDLEEVSANRRLSKHEMRKRGFSFDIYTERQSSLIVPYDMVFAHAKSFSGLRVASLEHLMALKLEAYLDRKESAKGDKDARDLLRIAAVANRGAADFDPNLVLPYLRAQHMALLDRVERGAHAMSLAYGNAMQAKRLRQEFSMIAQRVRDADALLSAAAPAAPPKALAAPKQPVRGTSKGSAAKGGRP